MAVLRTLPEPPVPAELAERVLAFTRPAAARGRRNAARGWSLALAAAVLLGIGIGLLVAWMAGTPSAGYQLKDGVVMVPAGSVTTVHIALDSAHPIRHVGFVIHVPRGLELQGHPGEPQVAWSGKLAQGRNVLNIDLIARPGAAGTLETELHYDGQSSMLRTPVVAEGAPWWNWITGLLSHLGLG
ncbi:MAG: hypothetical protein KGQ73_04055 [Gammaproteobacteria bacterium]|nr:hypothetical protein [Gammaproteobacteria bacterium]